MTIKLKLRNLLQPIFSLLRVKRYCSFGLNGLDLKLNKYLNFDNGIFIEAGANNGKLQSNTYYLEAIHNWRGILIEPIPELFAQCVKNRPKAHCIQAALVGNEYKEETVELDCAGLMSSVTGASGNKNYDGEHTKLGRQIQEIKEIRKIKVHAVTLSDIIKKSKFASIDLLSLDLEGYEAEALKGLDLEKHGPNRILIEVRNQEEITRIIGGHYDLEAILSSNDGYSDILYKRRSK